MSESTGFVDCFENRQRVAGTRRVHQQEHVRSLPAHRSRLICRTNVLADDRACTPVPPQHLHGKKGVDGSSPSEGSTKAAQIAAFSVGQLARVPVCGRYGAGYGAFSLGRLSKGPFSPPGARGDGRAPETVPERHRRPSAPPSSTRPRLCPSRTRRSSAAGRSRRRSRTPVSAEALADAADLTPSRHRHRRGQ